MATFTHVTTDSALTSYATFDNPPQVLAVPNSTTPIRYPLVPIETGEHIKLPPELSSRLPSEFHKPLDTFFRDFITRYPLITKSESFAVLDRFLNKHPDHNLDLDEYDDNDVLVALMIELGHIHTSSRSAATPYLLRSYWGMAAMPNRAMQVQVLMCIYLGYLGHEKECIDLQHAVCTNIISYPYLLDKAAIWVILHQAMWLSPGFVSNSIGSAYNLCRILEMPTYVQFVENFGYGGWRAFQQLTCYLRQQVGSENSPDYYILAPYTPQLQCAQALQTFNWNKQHLAFYEEGYEIGPAVLQDAVLSLEDLLRAIQRVPDLERRITYSLEHSLLSILRRWSRSFKTDCDEIIARALQFLKRTPQLNPLYVHSLSAENPSDE